MHMNHIMIIIAESSDDIPGQPRIPDGDQMTGNVDAPPPYEAPPPYPGQQGTHAVQFLSNFWTIIQPG